MSSREKREKGKATHLYEMPSLASFGDDVPVDGVDVAEGRVLLESHGTA